MFYFINKKVFLSSLFAISLSAAIAQTEIDIKEVEHHMGNTISICGNILSIRHLENVKNKPFLINLGGADATEHMDIIIGTGDSILVGQFDSLVNKKACVVGTPFYYKGGNEFVYLKAEYLRLEQKQIAASTVFKEQPIQEISTRTLLTATHNPSLKRTVIFNVGKNEPAKKQLLIKYLKNGRIASYRHINNQKIYVVQLRSLMDE